LLIIEVRTSKIKGLALDRVFLLYQPMVGKTKREREEGAELVLL
jgi:hypothetical protein